MTVPKWWWVAVVGITGLVFQVVASLEISNVKLSHISEAAVPVRTNLDRCGGVSDAELDRAFSGLEEVAGFPFPDAQRVHAIQTWGAQVLSSQLQAVHLIARAAELRNLSSSSSSSPTSSSIGTDTPLVCPLSIPGCKTWDCRAAAAVERLRMTITSLHRKRKVFRRALDVIDADLVPASEQLQRVMDAIGGGLDLDTLERMTATGGPTLDVALEGTDTAAPHQAAAVADSMDNLGRPCTQPPVPLPSASQCIVFVHGKYEYGILEASVEQMMTNFTCDMSCTFTQDEALLPSASVVLLHVWDPNGNALPKVRYCGQRYLYATAESPTVSGFREEWPRDLVSSNTFDGMATYRLDSDVPRPYFPYEGDAEGKGLFQPAVPYAEKHQDVLAAFVASNCDTEAVGRTDWVLGLMAHMAVDSYGTCLHNKDWPADGGDIRGWLAHDKRDMEAVLGKYKFLLVFENSRCTDYVTEKLWRAFRMGVVPVYIGAPNLKDFEPLPGTVLQVSDFRSPAELATHLKWLATNEEQYNHYLRFKPLRSVTQRFAHWWMTPRSAWQCRVCKWAQSATTRQLWWDRSCAYISGDY